MSDTQRVYWVLAFADLTKHPEIGGYLAFSPYYTEKRPYESPVETVEAAFAREGKIEIVSGTGAKESPFEVRLVSTPTWPMELSFLVCSCASCVQKREATVKNAKAKLQRLLMGGRAGPFSREEASVLGKEAMLGLFPFVRRTSYASYAVYSNDKYYYLTLTGLESPSEMVFRLATDRDVNTTLAEKVVSTNDRTVHDMLTAACEWAAAYLEEAYD